MAIRYTATHRFDVSCCCMRTVAKPRDHGVGFAQTLEGSYQNNGLSSCAEGELFTC